MDSWEEVDSEQAEDVWRKGTMEKLAVMRLLLGRDKTDEVRSIISSLHSCFLRRFADAALSTDGDQEQVELG